MQKVTTANSADLIGLDQLLDMFPESVRPEKRTVRNWSTQGFMATGIKLPFARIGVRWVYTAESVVWFLRQCHGSDAYVPPQLLEMIDE